MGIVHCTGHKVILKFQNYEDKNEVCHDLKGYIRLLLCQNHSSTFFYGLILIKICMNANIMKTHFFHKMMYDLKCHVTFMLWRRFVMFLL